jgi:hypothetical protein
MCKFVVETQKNVLFSNGKRAQMQKKVKVRTMKLKK